MNKLTAVAVAALVLTSAPAVTIAPALAVPTCSASHYLDSDWQTEAQINERHERELRARGVDVIDAEIWSGCIRAYVRTPDGGREMLFFDPLSFRQVY